MWSEKRPMDLLKEAQTVGRSLVIKQAQGCLLHDPTNTGVLCYNASCVCYPEGLRVL